MAESNGLIVRVPGAGDGVHRHVNDKELGEAIYTAMYGPKGGRWELVETKDVWYDIAGRVRIDLERGR